MDYISAGHFTVYDQLVSEAAKENTQVAADELYTQISATTDEALSFNDHYADIEKDEELHQFDRNLAKLGEQLEIRFELEDELIHALHTHHV